MTSHYWRFNVAGRKVVLVAALMSTMSCDDGRGVSPTSPTPKPQRQTWTLSGTVSETAPTASTRIAGATVTIIGGPNAGRSATSDATGVFQLALEPGDFTVRARAANYVEGSQPVTLFGNQTVTIELDPVFQMVTTTRNDSISGDDTCPGSWDYLKYDASPTSASQPCQVDYLFNVHHDGTLNAELTWTDRELGLSMQLFRADEVSDEGQPSGQVIESRGDGSHQQISYNVSAHRPYIVRVLYGGQLSVPPPARTGPFGLTVTRPS